LLIPRIRLLLIAATLLSPLCQSVYSAEKTDIRPSSLRKAKESLKTLLGRSNELTKKSSEGSARENSEATQNAAAGIMKSLGKDAIPALEYIALHDENHDLREAALNVLDHFDRYDPKKALFALLASASPEQRLFALQKLKSQSTKYGLTAAHCVEYVLPLLFDPDRQVRILSKKIIRAYITRIRDTANLIVTKTRKHKGPDEEKIQAVELLGVMINDRVVVDYFLELVSHAGDKLRYAVIRVLGYSKDPRAVEKLSALLEPDAEEPDEIRLLAAISLGRSGAQEALSPLIKTLGSDNRELRRVSGSSLRKITGKNLGTNPYVWETWSRIEDAKSRGTYRPGMFRTERPSPLKDATVAVSGRTKSKGFGTYAKFLIAAIAISILIFIYKFLLPGKGAEIGLRKIYVKSESMGAMETPVDEKILGKDVDSYIEDVEGIREISDKAIKIRKKTDAIRKKAVEARKKTDATRKPAEATPEPVAATPEEPESEISGEKVDTFDAELDEVKEFYAKRAKAPRGVPATPKTPRKKKPAKRKKPRQD
jgi:HEAT repeat protein